MKRFMTAAALATTLALGGCASLSQKDPFESYNRAMLNFNDAIDEAALKPAARAYQLLPGFVQTGVGNFFGNLGDAWTGVNNLLQGKVADGVSDILRVSLNSTFGLLGLLDISSEAGIPKHREDFGQTLGVWGVPAGPFVVLPLLGPSTLRDTAVYPIDIAADPLQHINSGLWVTSGNILRVIDQRAALLDATNLLEEAALDRYAFIRDSYLQRRQSNVLDGGSIRSSYQNEPDPQEDARPKSESSREAPPGAEPR